MSTTDHLALPFIDAAQAQKHVTHNAALSLLDCVVQLSVSARNVTAPPAMPLEGQRLLLGTGATGAFAGHDGAIATWQDGAWTFLTPVPGWRCFSEADGVLLIFNGTAFVDVLSLIKAAQNLDLLGINATATAQNPLSATLNAALFNALATTAGGTGDMRLVLNKAAAGNTVSQLYQDAFSGRAETGLAGDDHFHIKVSPDGASWHEAIAIDNASGLVSFPSGAALLPGFRNLLRNANFGINQRGVAGTVTLAAGAYGHDGVRAGAGGATYNCAASGIDTVLTITAGSLILPVEAGMIAGGSYILSQAGSAAARVWQGTGNAGTGNYASLPLPVAGLSVNTQTNIEFSAGTLQLPQFEQGLVATSFERRPASIEMLLCQRYFQALQGGVFVMSWGPGNAAGYGVIAQMRAMPTAALVDTGLVYLFGVGSGTVSSTDIASFSMQAASVFAIAFKSGSPATAANQPGFLLNANLQFSAEI
ncbi:MAG: DUF2793 domain-containing protein [Hyphomicrobiales bacterium]|nr:DUF2793 domain-containing protein [Hyphomicrobiales bacterium]